MQKFTQRLTSNKDCTKCHADRGIWRDPSDRRIYLCDECFSKHLHAVKQYHDQLTCSEQSR